MPKRVTQAELRQIEQALSPHPDGLSLIQLQEAIHGAVSRRTLIRRVAALLAAGRIHKRGEARATRYLFGPGPATLEHPFMVREGPPDGVQYAAGTTTAREGGVSELAGRFETPEGVVTIDLSLVAHDILDYVSRPAAARSPTGYDRRMLSTYVPNESAYIPEKMKVHLHKIGKPIAAERAAGTFARDILGRFLIDLSWASSRLEGNTYSRLDTERLIQFGQEAEGKDAKETQMVLNHKAAIELLVEESSDDIGMNRFTLLNLHALLSDNLMADPEASGSLRRRPVDISGSVYTPMAIPQVIEECFALLLEKASVIEDPFEQAFFVMVHLPYLQPFEDVNKRVSRLAANIPLIRADLCPMSFVDVPERAYIAGTMGVYELTRMELLRDVFVWAYERSCQRYVVIRDSVAEPDRFRMRYREALIEVVGRIVREKKRPSEAGIGALAGYMVEQRDVPKFVEMVSHEFRRLGEYNIARYRLRLSEYRAWVQAMEGKSSVQ